MTDPQTIASKLTATQRAYLLADWSRVNGEMIWDLAKDGLGLADAVGLTARGYALRTHLEKESKK